MTPKTPREPKEVKLSAHEARGLLYWATIGISRSVGGSYADCTERKGDMGIVNSIARQIGFSLPRRPTFWQPVNYYPADAPGNPLYRVRVTLEELVKWSSGSVQATALENRLLCSSEEETVARAAFSSTTVPTCK